MRRRSGSLTAENAEIAEKTQRALGNGKQRQPLRLLCDLCVLCGE